MASSREKKHSQRFMSHLLGKVAGCFKWILLIVQAFLSHNELLKAKVFRSVDHFIFISMNTFSNAESNMERGSSQKNNCLAWAISPRIMFGVNFSSNCFINHSRIVWPLIRVAFFPSHSEPPQLILFVSRTQRSYIIIFARLVFCLSSRVQNVNGTKKTNIHIIELIMFCGWRTKSPLFRCMFWSPATVTWIPKTTKSNYVTHFEAQNHEMHNNNQYRIHWNVLVHIIDVIACKLRWRQRNWINNRNENTPSGHWKISHLLKLKPVQLSIEELIDE